MSPIAVTGLIHGLMQGTIQGLGPETQAVLVVFLGVWAGTIGLPVPEEIPLLTAGVLAAVGVIPLHVAILAGALACFSADVTVFAVGRRIGRGLNRHPYLRRLMRGRYLLRARHMYVRRGGFALIVARLLPGLKMPFLFTAGAFRMKWSRFLALDVVSLLVLVPSLVLLGYTSSRSVAQLLGMLHRAALYGLAAFAIAAAAGLWISWAARRRRQVRRARWLAAGIPLRQPQRTGDLPSSWS